MFYAVSMSGNLGFFLPKNQFDDEDKKYEVTTRLLSRQGGLIAGYKRRSGRRQAPGICPMNLMAMFTDHC